MSSDRVFGIISYNFLVAFDLGQTLNLVVMVQDSRTVLTRFSK